MRLLRSLAIGVLLLVFLLVLVLGNVLRLTSSNGYVAGGALIATAPVALLVGVLVQRRQQRRAQEAVADRQRAEEALAQVEARNSAMLRAIPDLMFVLGRDGTYVDYHARDTARLLAPPQAFLGRRVDEIMAPELAVVFKDAIERASAGTEPVIVEYSLPMPGGERHYEARLVSSGPDRVLSIVRDITDSRAARELNRELAGRLITSQERERERIARELHDDISQRIGLLNVEIDLIADKVAAPDLHGRLRQLSRDAADLATEVHHLSYQLHPSRLQTLGLVAAIEALCDDTTQQAGVQVRFEAGALPIVADAEVSLCLYRIAQEALHNIRRHSGARDAHVLLKNEDGHLILQVADRGIGFDTRSLHAGLGLVSMRERVSFLRGQLVVHSAPGSGTRIGARVPVPMAAPVAAPLSPSASGV